MNSRSRGRLVLVVMILIGWAVCEGPSLAISTSTVTLTQKATDTQSPVPTKSSAPTHTHSLPRTGTPTATRSPTSSPSTTSSQSTTRSHSTTPSLSASASTPKTDTLSQQATITGNTQSPTTSPTHTAPITSTVSMMATPTDSRSSTPSISGTVTNTVIETMTQSIPHTSTDTLPHTVTVSHPTSTISITTTDFITDTITIHDTVTLTISQTFTMSIDESVDSMTMTVTETALETITETGLITGSMAVSDTQTMAETGTFMPDTCVSYGAPTWLMTTSFVGMGVRERNIRIIIPAAQEGTPTTTAQPPSTSPANTTLPPLTTPQPTALAGSTPTRSATRSHTQSDPTPPFESIGRRVFEHTYYRHVVYVPSDWIQKALHEWLIPSSEVAPFSQLFPQESELTTCPRCQGTGIQRMLHVGESISSPTSNTSTTPPREVFAFTHYAVDAVVFKPMSEGKEGSEVGGLMFLNESLLREAIALGDVEVGSDGRSITIQDTTTLSRLRTSLSRRDVVLDRLPASADALRAQDMYLRGIPTTIDGTTYTAPTSPVTNLALKPPGTTGFRLGSVPFRRRVLITPGSALPAPPPLFAPSRFIRKSPPIVSREEAGVTFSPHPTRPAEHDEAPPYVTPQQAHTVPARTLWSNGMLMGLNVMWDGSGDPEVGAAGRGGAPTLRTFATQGGAVNDGPLYPRTSGQGANVYSCDTEPAPFSTASIPSSTPAESQLRCPMPSAPKPWRDTTTAPAPRISSLYSLCAGIYRNVPLAVRTLFESEASESAAFLAYSSRETPPVNASVTPIFNDLNMDGGVSPFYVSDMAATIFVPFDAGEDAGEAAGMYKNKTQVDEAMREFKLRGFPEGHLGQCVTTNTSVVWLYIRPRNRRLPIFRTSTISLNLFGVGSSGDKPVLTVVQQLLLRSGAMLKRKMGSAKLDGQHATSTANTTTTPSVVTCPLDDTLSKSGREQGVRRLLVQERAMGKEICTSLTEGDAEVALYNAVVGSKKTPVCTHSDLAAAVFPSTATRQFLVAPNTATSIRDMSPLESSGLDLDPMYTRLPTMQRLLSLCTSLTPWGQWDLLRVVNTLVTAPFSTPRSAVQTYAASAAVSSRATLYEAQSLAGKVTTPESVVRALYASRLEEEGGAYGIITVGCVGAGLCENTTLQFQLTDNTHILPDGNGIVTHIDTIYHALESIPLVGPGRTGPEDWYYNSLSDGPLEPTPAPVAPACGGSTPELDIQYLNPIRRLLTTPWSTTALDAHNFNVQLYHLRGDPVSVIPSIALDLFAESRAGKNSTHLIKSSALQRGLLPNTMYYSTQTIQALELALTTSSLRQWFNMAPAWLLPWVDGNEAAEFNPTLPADAPFQRALADASRMGWGALVSYLITTGRPPNAFNEATAHLVTSYKGYVTNAEGVRYQPTRNALRCAANTLPNGVAISETITNGTIQSGGTAESSIRFRGGESPNPSLLELEEYLNEVPTRRSSQLTGQGGDQYMMSFVVVGEPSPISDLVTEAFQLAPYLALFLVSLVRTPLLLFLQTRAADLVNAGMCEVGAHTPLSLIVSPLQLSVGGGGARYYRGGLLGNSLLMAGFTLFILLVGFLIHKPRVKAASEIADRYSRMIANRREVHSHVMSAVTALSKKGTTFTPLLSRTEADIPFRIPSYGDSLLSLRVPGVFYVLIGALLYGTAVSSAALISHAETPFDLLLGSIGLAVLIGAVVLAVSMLQTVRTILHVMPMTDITAIQKKNSPFRCVMGILRGFVGTRSTWVMRGLMSAQAVPSTADLLHQSSIIEESPADSTKDATGRTLTGGTSARLFLHGRRMYAHLYSDIGDDRALPVFVAEMVVSMIIGILQGIREPDFWGGWGLPAPTSVNSVLQGNLNIPSATAQRVEAPTSSYSTVQTPYLQGLSYFAFDDPQGPFLQNVNTASEWISSLSSYGPMSVPMCTISIAGETVVLFLHFLFVVYFAIRYHILQTALLSTTYVICLFLLVLSSVAAFMSRVAYLSPTEHKMPAPYNASSILSAPFWQAVLSDNGGDNPYAFLFESGGEKAYADLYGWLFLSQLAAVLASMLAGTKVLTDLGTSIQHVRRLFNKRQAEAAPANAMGEAIPQGMDPEKFHQLHELKRAIMNGTVVADANTLTDEQAELLRDPSVLKYLYADDMRARVALKREHALQRALNRSDLLREAITKHEEWVREAEHRRAHATMVSDLLLDDSEDDIPRPPPGFWRDQLLVLPQVVRKNLVDSLHNYDGGGEREMLVDIADDGGDDMNLLLEEMGNLDDDIDKEQAAIATLQQMVGDAPLLDRYDAKRRSEEKDVVELREVLKEDQQKLSAASRGDAATVGKSTFAVRIAPLHAKATVQGGLPPPHSVLRFGTQRPPTVLDLL